MILGCVLAGGLSTRFGSDKALAQLDGQTLIARAVDALSGWCEHVVVAGRETAPAPTLPDWPRAGMGPLAGIAAALHMAQAGGYGAVMTIGVDSALLPERMLELLFPGPSYLADQPVIGLWPISAAGVLDTILTTPGRHSLRQFADAVGARPVQTAALTFNINTPADLAMLEHHYGL